MLGYPCVVISELVEVYEGVGDREDKGRMISRDRVCAYSEKIEAGVPDLRYFGRKVFIVDVICAWCSCSGGTGVLLLICSLANGLSAS